jgi:hypothetical protein
MPVDVPPDAMAEVLRQSIPSMKSQAQFTAFAIAFDSFRLLLDSIFSGNVSGEVEAKATLEKALEAARTATDITNKYEEVPEENRGKASTEFTAAPYAFGEYDIQKRLLGELTTIITTADLNTWYQTTKVDRDKVVTQSLRNILMDSIRQKKVELAAAVQL